MSFFTKIGNFFHSVGAGISHAFIAVFGQQAAHDFAQGAIALLKTDVGKLAATAVADVEKAAVGLASSQKQADAASAIIAGAKNLGLDLAAQAKSIGLSSEKSLVNMLIELALNAAKGWFGPPPTV